MTANWGAVIVVFIICAAAVSCEVFGPPDVHYHINAGELP